MSVRQESVTDGMMQLLCNTGLSLVPLASLRFVPRPGEVVNLDGEGFTVERVSYFFKSDGGDESELASVAVNLTPIGRPS